MFINNYDNRIIFEFIGLTNNNYIRFVLLIFHLIHCMQSLNGEFF